MAADSGRGGHEEEGGEEAKHLHGGARLSESAAWCRLGKPTQKAQGAQSPGHTVATIRRDYMMPC